MHLSPNGRLLGVACSALAAVSCASTVTLSAHAADFSHAQKTYVAPSSIDRRIDFASVREHQTVSLSKTKARVPRTTTISSSTSVGGKGTLLPPLPGKTPGKTTYSGISFKQAMSTPQAKAYINQLKGRAKQYVADGRFEEAKQQLAVALKLTSEQKAMLREVSTTGVERARKLLTSQDLDGAVRAARQALVLDATNPDAQKTLSDVLQSAGVNPGDVTARLRAAHLLAEQGRNDEASIEYRVAARLKPTAESYIGLGNVHLRAGEKEAARANYLKAMEVEPSSAAAHRQMGFLRYSERDIVGANADLSRALVLDPKDTTAGRALVELWQQQTAKVPGANSHMGLARAYQLSGDLTSAQAQYREVVRIDPNNPHLPAARHSFKLALSRQQAARAAGAASTLAAQRAYGAAYQKISEAVTLSPGDGSYHYIQGDLLEKLGNPGAAHQAYMNVLKHDPTNNAAAARIKAISTTPAATPVQSQPQAVAPAGMPFPSHDPVQNLSNFATSLRDHMVGQQHALNAHEDAILAGVHALAKQQNKPVGESLVTAAVGTSVPDTAPGGVQNALAQAASALSATGTTAQAAVAAAPSIQAFAPPAQAFTPAAQAIAPAAEALAPVTQAIATAPSFLRPPIGSLPEYTGATNTGPLSHPAITGMSPGSAPSYAAPGPPPSPEPSFRGAQSANAGAPPQAVPQPITQAQPGQVRLELEAASPKIDGVHLEVVLRNDSDVPLELPRKMRAVLKYASRDSASVKVAFNQPAVPAHSIARGTITVPFNKVDPTADVVLTDLMPPGSAVRDVHLTTAISLR